MQALKSNPKLSGRGAAKIYNVTHTTLMRRIHGQPSGHDTIANYRKLTFLEEEAIIQRIIELDSQAFPPRLSSVKDMANRLLRERDAPPIGRN